ncbi:MULTISPECIES: monovalent cation/H(+) antiporter subunit G [Auritidibacter]|uniref:monovalent cation/H(+) antiporter subunit G n=1 Tax=Auritidibacter TaxID=1160973 RepID=UPI000D7273E6|nr:MULTISPECIES: monovalent cation/H(+) antiporter subunit G [Auritidibacter]PXA81069.1 sodium:proton antiporter [Auritidibacter sp. NML120636]WHS28669.1 monovalent cation/H(+) antiporter subunit G [Auritidibacter ignavus]
MIEFESGWEIAGAILIVVGCSQSATAGIGLLRFPDVLSRIHAATKPQVFGLLTALAGLGCIWQSWWWVPVLVVAWVLQLVTAPVSAHLVGRATYRSRHLDPELLYVDELAAVITRQDEKDQRADHDQPDESAQKPAQNS